MKIAPTALAAMFAVTLAALPAARMEAKTPPTKKATPATKPLVAVFSLKGPVTESPRPDDLLFASARSQTLRKLVERMKKAAADTRVKAVVLLAGNTAMGPGQIEELRSAMNQLKAAGKEVAVHANSLRMPTYVLFSGASQLSIVPTGDVLITGIYAEQLYLRGLLDKIGVRPDFLTCGTYKSAAEMFTQTGPSPEAEEMYSWLFDGLFAGSVKLIAEGRGVPTEKVRSWIDGGLYSAESAKKQGIIDSVEHRQDFVARLKKQYGEEVQFDKKYAKKKQIDVDFSSPFGLVKFWSELFQGGKKKKPAKKTIAIVHVDGPIVPGAPEPSPFGTDRIAYSTPIRKALDKVAEDDSVKAVVLRVSSPGGSAVASEIILNATRRVKAKKPLVVSMGDVAASGGYYVACGADTIFADGVTITGSIGVVAGKLATTGMWTKLGVTWKPIKRGANSGIFSSQAVFSKDEREKVQAWMDEIYGVFKGHVEAIRGDRLKKPLDEIAGGRVYTGRQALELGLVDRIGGLDDAVGYAAEQAGLKDYAVQVVPRPKNFMEMLFRDLADGDDDEDPGTIRLAAGRSSSRSLNGLLGAALPLLDKIEPARARAVRTALRQLELLNREQVLLMMPPLVLQP